MEFFFGLKTTTRRKERGTPPPRRAFVGTERAAGPARGRTRRRRPAGPDSAPGPVITESKHHADLALDRSSAPKTPLPKQFNTKTLQRRFNKRKNSRLERPKRTQNSWRHTASQRWCWEAYPWQPGCAAPRWGSASQRPPPHQTRSFSPSRPASRTASPPLRRRSCPPQAQCPRSPGSCLAVAQRPRSRCQQQGRRQCY